LKKPLAEELLFGQLMQGGQVSITAGKDKLDVKIVRQDALVNH
jgi:hypothetical protein